MFRKELILLGGIALMVFVLVAGIASLAVRAAQREASMVAQDTLPGLVNAGEAIDRLNENWLNTYRLLNVDAASERARIINTIETNSTSELWKRYGESIYDARDARLFHMMENSRAEFLVVRSNYFVLVKSGEMDAARKIFTNSLEAVSKKYHRASGDIFLFNAEIGKHRADRIIQLGRWTPFVAGGFCVVILLVGVFIGFKASLGAFSRAASDYAQLRK